ncbi:helix-turn-helix domain-containing protein [Labilibacter marinus]|uniref:helix-turn-helix domain-containing protein n=1 Tax=Labilibacter marinus TaxID=1477105 RepID=UPI000834D7D7|nr:helix-turn-helix transcriptional regulator [Labilibacter marinus]
MKQRLQTLLTTEKMASSKFADLLGVNRSSISHLLSGRNNPSLDFLQKVLLKFPHINPDWLLLGQGNMYRNSKGNQVSSAPNTIEFNEEKPIVPTPILETPKQVIKEPLLEVKQEKQAKVSEPEDAPVYTSKKEPKEEVLIDSSDKQVERIVIFYTNGTFDTYTPNQKI